MSSPTFTPDVYVDVTAAQYAAWVAAGKPTSGANALPAGAIPIVAAGLNRLGVAMQTAAADLLTKAAAADVTALTATVNTNTTNIAAKYTKPGTGIPLGDLASAVIANFTTPAQVDTRIAALIGGAPAALDTLKEIADQLALDETAAQAIAGRLTTAEGTLAALPGTYGQKSVVDSHSTILAGLTGDLGGPLALLHSLLAARRARRTLLAFTGSSTTSGTGPVELNYVQRTLAGFQVAYPSGLGTETSVVGVSGTPSTAAGVHAIGLGIGGTTSAANSFLPTATLDKIAATQPCVVFIQIGSNDVGSMDAATYKSNVLARLGELRARITGPCVYVLLHTPSKQGINQTTWATFRQALADVAAANSADVLLVDLNAVTTTVTYPGVDPLQVGATDGVHFSDVGHAIFADTIFKKLLIATTAGTPAPARPAPADTTAPSVPATPTATAGQQSATATTTGSTDDVGVTGYRWYRAGTLVGTTTSTSFTESSLPAGTAVAYTVAAGDAAGNWSAQSAASNSVTPTAASTIADNFNRADSTTGLGTSSSGSPWTATKGVMGISSNQGCAISLTGAEAIATQAVANGDHYAELKMVATTETVWLLVRCSADGASFYALRLDPNGAAALYRRNSGTLNYSTDAGTWAVGDVMRASVKATTITALKNGVAVTNNGASSITGGSPGVRLEGTAARFDDFAAGLT